MSTNLAKNSVREKVSFSGQPIYLGIDVHKLNWNVSVYLGESFYQSFHQESSGDILKNYLDNNLPGGDFYACYEAGFCGFSVQRELSSKGINCIVVNAADVPQTNKGAFSKTDTVDSRRLGLALAKGMLTPIYVPSEELEADRQLLRYRRKTQQLLQAKRKVLKSLFFTSGIKIPKQYDTSY